MVFVEEFWESDLVNGRFGVVEVAKCAEHELVECSKDLKIFRVALLGFLGEGIVWVLIVPLEGRINTNKTAGERIGDHFLPAVSLCEWGEELGVDLGSDAAMSVAESADREHLESSVSARGAMSGGCHRSMEEQWLFHERLYEPEDRV